MNGGCDPNEIGEASKSRWLSWNHLRFLVPDAFSWLFLAGIANGNVGIASRTMRAQRNCPAESAADAVHDQPAHDPLYETSFTDGVGRSFVCLVEFSAA